MNTKWAGKLFDPFFSLIVFSIYSGFIGGTLLFAPRIILPQFGVHQEVNSFTFMLGMALICLSFYYFAAGIAKDRFFAKLTVYTRLAIPFVTMSLYLAGNVPFHYVLLGILDACSGIWTFLALRKTRFMDAAKPQPLYLARNS
jgi:hypothetical protein